MLLSTLVGDLVFLAVIQTAIKTAGPSATTLRLFQNDFSPSRSSVAVDFTEATFDGYSGKAQAWAIGPFLNGALQAEIQGASANWTPTGGTTPNTIYGWWLEDATHSVFAAQRFDSPRTMNGGATSLTLVPSLILVPGGISGNAQPID